jgi:hypothetical protein
MSSELTTVDQTEVNALLKQLGTVTDDQIKVAFLNTQYKPDDKQGRDVNKHRGSFYLSSQTNPVYAKEVKARFLCQHFQYRVSNTEPPFNTMNKTVLMDDIRKTAEPIDMKGGIRCGRPDPKVWRNLDAEDRKNYSHIKAYRILKGIVSYTGETADGEEVTVENEPFQLWHKGMNYMQFDRQVVDALKGSHFHNMWTDLSNKKDGMAYITNFTLDFKTPAAMTQDVVDTLRTFLDMVKQENEMITSAWHKNNSPDDLGGALDAVATILPDDAGLEADFA